MKRYFTMAILTAAFMVVGGLAFAQQSGGMHGGGMQGSGMHGGRHAAWRPGPAAAVGPREGK
jgi:hypothetical protein